MNRREQFGFFPTSENTKENKIEKEKEQFFIDLEKDFEGTKVLEALYQLKEHSSAHFFIHKKSL